MRVARRRAYGALPVVVQTPPIIAVDQVGIGAGACPPGTERTIMGCLTPGTPAYQAAVGIIPAPGAGRSDYGPAGNPFVTVTGGGIAIPPAAGSSRRGVLLWGAATVAVVGIAYLLAR